MLVLDPCFLDGLHRITVEDSASKRFNAFCVDEFGSSVREDDGEMLPEFLLCDQLLNIGKSPDHILAGLRFMKSGNKKFVRGSKLQCLNIRTCRQVVDSVEFNYGCIGMRGHMRQKIFIGSPHVNLAILSLPGCHFLLFRYLSFHFGRQINVDYALLFEKPAIDIVVDRLLAAADFRMVGQNMENRLTIADAIGNDFLVKNDFLFGEIDSFTTVRKSSAIFHIGIPSRIDQFGQFASIALFPLRAAVAEPLFISALAADWSKFWTVETPAARSGSATFRDEAAVIDIFLVSVIETSGLCRDRLNVGVNFPGDS